MTDQSSNHLPRCRATCAASSTEFTHVRPETTSEGTLGCRCFKPKDDAPSDAQPIYLTPTFVCKVDNLTALTTGDMGQIYVDNCLQIPSAHAEVKQRVANDEYRVVSNSTYSCFADTNRCFVRSSLQQQQNASTTSSSATPTSNAASASTAEASAGGTVVTPQPAAASAPQPAATATTSTTTENVAQAKSTETVTSPAPVASVSDGSTSADPGITISLSNAAVATTPETTTAATASTSEAVAQRPHNARYVHPSGYALAPPPTATVSNGANAVTAI